MTYRMPNLPAGSCKYGAPMGRAARVPEGPDTDAPRKLRLSRLAMCGDYDTGGAYWGCESPGQLLYVASDDDETRIVVRAPNRAIAAALVRKEIPGATFRGLRWDARTGVYRHPSDPHWPFGGPPRS